MTGETFDLARIGVGLPVAAAIGDVADALTAARRLVLTAPPGTGKTTLVPPLLANHTTGRVVVTQPRRVAARAAAQRLATLAGVRLGAEVGYTVRGDARISRATRIEFCTAGVLLRRLLAEPDLPGVTGVILDEVHERQLESDLALAMIREVAALRDDLMVVAMSATLAADRFAAVLGEDGVEDDLGQRPAPVVEVAGVLHPLTVTWAAPPAGVRVLDHRGVTDEFLQHVAATTARALTDFPGDALVFVPGAREVERVVELLRSRTSVAVLPLHGQLTATAQDTALAGGDGARRVVVTTAVAESSLTVPGVRLVVDSGLAREARYDSGRGITGLVTRTVARASAEQRAGRAARLGPGAVVRCFAEDTWARLDPAPAPELMTADLTRAALDLACWGTPRWEDLTLLEPLPVSGLARAEETLRQLGAVDSSGRATTLGRRLASVPTDPRLAKALLAGAERFGVAPIAEVVAALESDQRAPGADLGALVRDLRHGRTPAAGSWRREVSRLGRLVAAADSPGGMADEPEPGELIGWVVATAFPDRIARRRSADPHSTERAYLLTGGTGADLPADTTLGRPAWLAVAQLNRSHTGSGAVIRAAVALPEDLALAAGATLLTEQETATWSDGRVTGSRIRRLGAVELTRTPIRARGELARHAVARALHSEGLELLSWQAPAITLRRRLGFLAHRLGPPWPAMSDEALLANPERWLGPELDALAEGASVATLDLVTALRRLLPWPEAGRLDELVPERLEVPTGSRIRLAYPADPADRPVLAVKLQECFGLTETPRVAGVPVLFHLLSPAGRPLAVTDDLASFWVNAYPQVRAENRGRYRKHPWPEDPLTASPRRGTTRSGR